MSLHAQLEKIRKSKTRDSKKYAVEQNNRKVLKLLTHIYADILMPYQLKMIVDQSPVMLVTKSRQIGFSYTMSLATIYYALLGYDVYYNSYNERSSRLQVLCTTRIVMAINAKLEAYGLQPITESEPIANSITFNNLARFCALSSNDNSFRGISGRKTIAVIDEARCRISLNATLKSAMGLLVWGGRVIVASTFDGEDNDFFRLYKKVVRGELNYSHHHVPITKAISDGLVKKICSATGINWTKEYEKQWLEELVNSYEDADEELFCIPNKNSKSSSIIIRDNIQTIPEIYANKSIFGVRYWDFASTISKNSYYTASVLMVYISDINTVVISGFTMDKLKPLDVIDRVKNVVQLDSYGINITNVLEKEPGSSGDIFVTEMIESHLVGFSVDSYQPRLKKEIRLFPVGQAFKMGKLKIVDAPWTEEFIDWIVRFNGTPQPGVNDLCDCLSGSWDYIKHNISL